MPLITNNTDTYIKWSAITHKNIFQKIESTANTDPVNAIFEKLPKIKKGNNGTIAVDNTFVIMSLNSPTNP